MDFSQVNSGVATRGCDFQGILIHDEIGLDNKDNWYYHVQVKSLRGASLFVSLC